MIYSSSLFSQGGHRQYLHYFALIMNLDCSLRTWFLARKQFKAVHKWQHNLKTPNKSHRQLFLKTHILQWVYHYYQHVGVPRRALLTTFCTEQIIYLRLCFLHLKKGRHSYLPHCRVKWMNVQNSKRNVKLPDLFKSKSTCTNQVQML